MRYLDYCMKLEFTVNLCFFALRQMGIQIKRLLLPLDPHRSQVTPLNLCFPHPLIFIEPQRINDRHSSTLSTCE